MSDDEFDDEPEIDDEDLDDDLIVDDDVVDDVDDVLDDDDVLIDDDVVATIPDDPAKIIEVPVATPIVEEIRRRGRRCRRPRRGAAPRRRRRGTRRRAARAHRGGRPRRRRGRGSRARRSGRRGHQDRSPPPGRVPLHELFPRAAAQPARRREPRCSAETACDPRPRQRQRRFVAAAATGLAARALPAAGRLRSPRARRAHPVALGVTRHDPAPAALLAFVAGLRVLRHPRLVGVVLRCGRGRAVRGGAQRCTGPPRPRHRTVRQRGGRRNPFLIAAIWVLARRWSPRWPFGGFSWGEVGYALHDVAPARSLAAARRAAARVVRRRRDQRLVARAASPASRCTAASRRPCAAPAPSPPRRSRRVVVVTAVRRAFALRPTPPGSCASRSCRATTSTATSRQAEIDARYLPRSHFALAQPAHAATTTSSMFPESSLDGDPRNDPYLAPNLVATAARLALGRARQRDRRRPRRHGR